MNACCRFRRGVNDALHDESDNRAYCGDCWQRWVIANKKKVDAKPAEPQQPESPEPESDGDGSDVKADEVLEGVVHTDGNLYLVERSKKAVYGCERDDNGDLVVVGDVCADGTIKLHAAPPELPFPVDPSDNCETPQEAYDDLAPMLRALASQLHKPPCDLEIYDPYYCDGGVKSKLSRLGFTKVHNEPVDFYTCKPPRHDVVVTNPPYSGDHIERLFSWLVKNKKPWFVALPNFVYTKPYFQNLAISPYPFFLVPSTPRRYVYVTPMGMRKVKSAQRKTSPFVSFWYCWAGQLGAPLFRWWAEKRDNDALTLCCTERYLPNEFKDSNDPTRRKKRKKKSKERNTETNNGAKADETDGAKRNMKQKPKLGMKNESNPSNTKLDEHGVDSMKEKRKQLDGSKSEVTTSKDNGAKTEGEMASKSQGTTDVKAKRKERNLVTDGIASTPQKKKRKTSRKPNAETTGNEPRRNGDSKSTSVSVVTEPKAYKQGDKKRMKMKKAHANRLSRLGMK